MSTTLLFVALAGWLGIGLVLASVLGRRGHDRFSWFVLGALLGPLAVAFAVYAWRHEEEAEPRTVAAAPPVPTTVIFRDDSVDVLLGFDGSPGSHAAIASVIGLFGARLRRLTLMTVIPFDGGAVNERQARTALQHEAERLAWLAPEIEVVRGEPARTLAATATSGGFDLLGVGTAGGGRPRLSGSATRHLTGQSRVPVLVLVTGPAAAT